MPKIFTAALRIKAEEFLEKNAREFVTAAKLKLKTASEFRGSFTPSVKLIYKGDEKDFLIKMMLDMLPPDIHVRCVCQGDDSALNLEFYIVPMGTGGNLPYNFFTFYEDSNGKAQDNYEHMRSLSLNLGEGQYKSLKAYENAKGQLDKIQEGNGTIDGKLVHQVLGWVVDHPDHGIESFQTVVETYYSNAGMSAVEIPAFLDLLNAE